MRQHHVRCVRQTRPLLKLYSIGLAREWKMRAHTTYYTILSNKYVVNDDDDDTHWTGWITQSCQQFCRTGDESREEGRSHAVERDVGKWTQIGGQRRKKNEKLRFNRVGRNAWIHRQAVSRDLSMPSLVIMMDCDQIKEFVHMLVCR